MADNAPPDAPVLIRYNRPIPTHLQTVKESRITIAEFDRIAAEKLPFVKMMGLQLESVDHGRVVMRARYSDAFLRPGGTVSGPVMMTLADAAMYALVLSHIGPVELAVTTQLSINFLRKPAPGDIIAEASLLKLGKRLAVGEVSLYSDGELTDDHCVAHVTTTYSIPPER